MVRELGRVGAVENGSVEAVVGVDKQVKQQIGFVVLGGGELFKKDWYNVYVLKRIK